MATSPLLPAAKSEDSRVAPWQDPRSKFQIVAGDFRHPTLSGIALVWPCGLQDPLGKRINMKGKFITFEGSEGCGKSTQSEMLFKYLKAQGLKAIYLREPGGVQLSEMIREILLNPKSKICPAAETLLYMAARAQVVEEIIKPTLSSGKIVICDRFLDSTIAYQGYGLGIDVKLIKSIGNFATQGIQPDLTIFLDLPVKSGLKHRYNCQDRIEQRSVSYHEKVRRGYLALAKAEPRRIKIVKVAEDKFKTQDNIREIVDAF
jgi:dTMP kinase